MDTWESNRINPDCDHPNVETRRPRYDGDGLIKERKDNMTIEELLRVLNDGYGIGIRDWNTVVETLYLYGYTLTDTIMTEEGTEEAGIL